jgi:hypothetical protein
LVWSIDFTGLDEAKVHVDFVLQETEVLCVPRQVVDDAQPNLAGLPVGANGVNGSGVSTVIKRLAGRSGCGRL